MDVRSLRTFLRVAELGSISRAALALNVVQPAISRQIGLLEQDLGAQLFVRHRRGMSLTESGQLLKHRAAGILADMEETRRAVSASAREVTGSVSIGLPTSMLYVLSADLAASFRSRYPKALLRIYEGLGHAVEQQLRDELVDMAILISPKPMRGVSLTPLGREQLYLAGPPDSDLDISSPVSLSRLATLPMIMLSARNKVRLIVEQQLSASGATLTPALEVEGQPLALELVRRGVGHMILPHCAIAAEMAAGRVRGAPIRGASLTWALGCNATRAKAPAVTALVDLLTELSAIRFAAKPQAPANRAAGASRSAKTAKARRRRSLRP